MCGGGDQTVTQRTELAPELSRLLYGGALGPEHGVGVAGPVGARGGTAAATFDQQMGGGGDGYEFGGSTGSSTGGGALRGTLAQIGSYLPGGINTANPSSLLNTTAAQLTSRPQGAPTVASSPQPRPSNFAMGGDVSSGIASLRPEMPLMQGGQLPNLSNPEIAATLAMAQMRPHMMMGMGSGGMSQQAFAVGGYVEGPGTGTSDDIPATIFQDGVPVQKAALSDGEFVMTERAVRGAGGGDRDRGAARMYEMMRMFERGGRV